MTASIGSATGLLNFLYGIQWILFAGLSMYLWWRWCREWAYQRDEEIGAGAPSEAEHTRQSGASSSLGD